MNALLLALTLVSTAASTPATPAKADKVWTCSAPRGLQNDAVQTVRVCEFK